MKKSVTFRFDNDLLERVRRSAHADNRSLTNFVETALLRALEDAPERQTQPDGRKPFSEHR